VKELKKIQNTYKTDSLKYNTCQKGLPGDTLFVDIETTGLSPARSHVCLIGAAYCYGDSLVCEQVCAGSGAEEEILTLSEHLNLIRSKKFRRIITFNGNSFDIPFLKERCRRLGMDSAASVYDNIDYVDLYRKYAPYRLIFGLENCKQTTFESFLGIGRECALSGRELADALRESGGHIPQVLSDALLLHNREDITGMAQLLALDAYADFFDGGFEAAGACTNRYRTADGSGGLECFLSLSLKTALPVPVSCGSGPLRLHAREKTAQLRIPALEGTLKYFYPDYRNYYYLPDEDMAIHKSVAAYVDKNHRERAKAANCYSKKTGVFLPQNGETVTPAFYEEYRDQKQKDAVCYFELTEDLTENPCRFKEYCLHILESIKNAQTWLS